MPLPVQRITKLLRCSIAAWCCLWLFAPANATPNPAESLIKSGEAALRIDPDLSKRNAEAALAILKQQPDTDLQIQALLQLCDYYAERDQAAAQQQLDQAKALLPQAKRTGLQASVANYQGEIYEATGDNPKALEFYQQAVTLAQDAQDDEMLAKALYSRGYIIGVQGQYAAGLQDLQQAQALFEKLNQKIYALNALNSIALLYNRLGDYQQAIHIHEQALAIQQQQGMRREQAVTLHNLGRAYENLGNWDKAREHFDSSLKLCQELRYTRLEAYVLRGLAAVANAQKQPRRALEILKQANDLQATTPDERLHGLIQLVRGTALHQLQDNGASIAALEDAADIFTQSELLSELRTAKSELSSVYAEQGNWRKAYEVRSEAMQLETQILYNQLDQRFATLKIEFDTTTKEKENELLTRENAANQTALAQAAKARKLQTLVIVLAAILLAILGTQTWRLRRGKQQMSTLALTDELTQMPNRRAALGRLQALLRKRNNPCAILIIDLDHFKRVNDEFGHLAGDETLRTFSAHLRRITQDPAFLGRLGGEEFILVLPNFSIEQAAAHGEQVRTTVAALDISHCVPNQSITVSIGITTAIGGDTPSSMLHRADKALYAAKSSGRNCVKCNPEPATDNAYAMRQLRSVS